jgi:hypothetical protein
VVPLFIKIYFVILLCLFLAIMICFTSLKGPVNKDDMFNIFLPIAPNPERLDRNRGLVKAIRWIYTIIGILLLIPWIFIGVSEII